VLRCGSRLRSYPADHAHARNRAARERAAVLSRWVEPEAVPGLLPTKAFTFGLFTLRVDSMILLVAGSR